MTLNGPSKIYHLKPVFQLPEYLEQNCPMYKMRNLHQQPASRKSPVENTTDNSADDSNESISKVLKRQEELIQHLQNIQSKVTDLKQELTNASSSGSSVKPKSLQGGAAENRDTKKKNNSVSTDGPVNIKKVIDKNIVINVSPTRPAYSVLILPHLWRNVFATDPTIHVHSTVKRVPDAFSKRSQTPQVGSNGPPPPLNLRLIWKDVPDTELISSPIKHSPLLGEVSMLRLFHRLLSPTTSSLSAEDQVGLDSVLDTSHQLLYATQKHAALALAKKLAENLGSNEWMLGSSSLSIADAAAWSAILNNKSISPNQLGPNMVQWSQKISALAGLSESIKK